MVIPIISERYWLDRSDLVEIETAIDHMLVNLSRGNAPITLATPPSIRGRIIQAAGASNTVRPRQIKGGYNRQSKNITLEPLPNSTNMNSGLIVELADDLFAFRLAMRSLLAHEVSHVRQDGLSGGSLDQDFIEAELASKKAQQTKSYEDYLRYLLCPVEIAAHATQLAVEVLDSYGARLNESDFTSRCRQSWVFRRAYKNPDWTSDNEQIRLQSFKTVADTWIDQAMFAYKRLNLEVGQAAEGLPA